MSTVVIIFLAACVAGLMGFHQPRRKPVKRKPRERIHHAIIVCEYLRAVSNLTYVRRVSNPHHVTARSSGRTQYHK